MTQKFAFRRDIYNFLLLIFISFIIINFTPKIIFLVFLCILFYMFYKSKKRYFWLAFFFTLIFDTGGLFIGQTEDILSIGPIDISLLTIFTYASIIIVYGRKKVNVNLFQKPLIVWLIYLFFLIFIGLFFGLEGGGKSGLRHYFQIIRFLMLLPILFVLPKLFEENSIEKFSNLIFICIFINLIGQIFFIFYKDSIALVLGSGWSQNYIGMDEKLIRPVIGAWHSLMAFFLAFYLLVKKNKFFSFQYLSIIISLSFISIFITATRGWILAFLGFLCFTLVLFPFKKMTLIFRVLFYAVALLIMIYATIPFVKIQVDKSLERFETIEGLAEGDFTLGGTNVRLTTRHDKVMKVFYESPIVGKGFSTDVMIANDQHVGNQTMLMSGGIVGYFIFLYMLGFIIKKIYFKHKVQKKNQLYNNELLFPIIFIFSLFMIHSTSTALFGYSIYVKAYGNMFYVAFAFSIINRILLDHKQYSRIKSTWRKCRHDL